MNTHTIIADMHQDVLKIRGDVECADLVVSGTRVPPFTERVLTIG